MNNLTVFYYEGTFVADSREVAAMVEKDHKHLLRDIKGYSDIITQSNFGLSNFFIPSTYQDSTGRTLPCYYLTRKGCDMVANKLTGRKGVLFTAAYVTKFEAMEKALANPNQIIANEVKKLRAEAMLLNAKTRQAKMIKDLARQFQSQLSHEAVQSLLAGVTEFILGQPLLPLPEIEKTYTASEIAKEAGVSRYTIGRLANRHGLKTEENGITVLSTIPPQGKQVPVFRYNEQGKTKLMELAGGRK
jgi:Rha family phage regulatory protein